jgi:hypothetical protein
MNLLPAAAVAPVAVEGEVVETPMSAPGQASDEAILIESGGGGLIPAGGEQEIDSEATAPAPMQSQQSLVSDPRIAELAGRLKTLEVGADKYLVENPEAAAKFAGNKAMQEYLNQRLTRERDVHPFRRFVTGVANAIPANDTSALGHFARGYRGVRGEYDKEQKAQEATMGELAGVQGDQAIYDAIMKRGQEAGQFYNPQEAGEFERLQMEQKTQLDAQEMGYKRLREEEIRGNRIADNERADAAAARAQGDYDYRVSQRGQLTPYQKLMDERRQASMQGGQSDAYKPPPISAVDNYMQLRGTLRKTEPEVVDHDPWFGPPVMKPNPDYVSTQADLEYLTQMYPQLNPAGQQQPQQTQQQGNPQMGQALEKSISDLMRAVPTMTRDQAMQVLSPHLPR